MRQRLVRVAGGLAALALGVALTTAPLSGQGPLPPGINFQAMQPGGDGGDQRRYPDFASVVKGAREHDGLFKLYQKEEVVYAELQPQHFNKPLLCPIAIAKGGGMLGGMTLNDGEDPVLIFKRVGDKVQLIRRNVRFRARPGSPASVAVQTSYTDSVLMALPIRTMNPARGSVLISLNDIFMTNFAQLPFGGLDPNRSTWHKVKTFPKNIELQVQATFTGGGGRFSMMFGGDDSVIDPRGRTLVLHYGLVELPQDGYQPRLADARVGHFLSVVKDFSKDDKDTSFVRYINRWRLERADGSVWKEGGKLVPPKKKIVFWIEKSVPDEYRPYVREGILEWNKAFEKIGFRDAIEVRQQEDDASGDFDPEDIRYATFRWITTDIPFAIGPSRANPLTGEILDADILFDASWLQYWKQEAKQLTRGTTADGRRFRTGSPIEALDMGLGLAKHPLLYQGSPLSWDERAGKAANDDEVEALRQRLERLRRGTCQCTAHKHLEMGLAAMAVATLQQPAKPGDKPADKDKEKEAANKAVEEMIAQAIKEVTMHEVGHTLGLRHNFKASAMLKNEQLHDTTITRKQGLVGSVMDYSPVNLAPKGTKQGDYFTTTLGPYDYWAIEYAYKPLSGGTEGEVAELKKVGAKGASPGLDYGTDEDRGLVDPLINVYDLGDPIVFGKERVVLAQDLMKDLAERVVEGGESYQRARRAFDVLLSQYGNAAYLVSRYVGGEFMNRDHKGDPNGRDPFVPVPAARQRDALKFVQEHILTDKPFQFPPQLLRKLGVERWYQNWGNDDSLFGSVEYPLYDEILFIQRVVLRQMLSPSRLSRIQTNALMSEKEEPLTVAEVFRSLTDSIWTDLGAAPTKSNFSALTIRRNLQREHLKDLSTLVLGRGAREFDMMVIFSNGGGATPPDAKSLARMHLREIDRKIETVLKERGAMLDDTSRAHLEDSRERITKVLNASMQASD